MAPSSSSRHLSVPLLLALLAFLSPARGQSHTVEECVSTPGVNVQLLSACESLRSQITLGQTAGNAALTTQIQLTPASSTNSNGRVTSSGGFGVAQTSAVASSGDFGGFGESSSSIGPGGFGGVGSSSATQGFGGFGGQFPTSSDASFPFPVSSSASSHNGIDSGLGAGSTGGSPSNTNGGAAGSTPTDSSAVAGASGSGDPSSTDATGAQNSDAASLTQQSTNTSPHNYRNTVVIPVAVVCTVVPILLLAMLACCLLRRRRKRKTSQSALIANAENEKYGDSDSNGHGQAPMSGGAAAPLVGAKWGPGNHAGKSNPFADPQGSNGLTSTGQGAYGAHQGLGSGTVAGLGAGAALGAAAAGIASHGHSKRESSIGARSSISSGQIPAGMRPSGIPPAYTAYGPSGSNTNMQSPPDHPGAASGSAAGLSSSTSVFAAPNPHTGPSGDFNASLSNSAPSNAVGPYSTDGTSGPYHQEPGFGMAAGLGAGAGAMGLAAHELRREPSTPSNYSSAASQQNMFHGFSGGNTPLESSPAQTSNHTPRVSTLAPTAAGLGAAGVGAGALAHHHHREDQATIPSGRERPPTLPPMDPSMGSGSWLSGQYDDNRNMPQDPSSFYSSDSGATIEAAYNRAGTRPQSPPANYSRPQAPTNYGLAAAPAVTNRSGDDPFRTPEHSVRESYDYASPDLPRRSSQRTPPLGVQSMATNPLNPVIYNQSPTHLPVQPAYTTPQPPQPSLAPVTPTQAPHPNSPLKSESKPSRVLGLDPRVDRPSPPPATAVASPPSNTEKSTITDNRQEPTISSIQSTSWQPPAIGQVIEGPFRGSAYQPPHIGAEDGATTGSSQVSTEQSSISNGQRGEQFTRVPSPDEVRSFDFGNGGGSEDRWDYRRKPVGKN